MQVKLTKQRTLLHNKLHLLTECLCLLSLFLSSNFLDFLLLDLEVSLHLVFSVATLEVDGNSQGTCIRDVSTSLSLILSSTTTYIMNLRYGLLKVNCSLQREVVSHNQSIQRESSVDTMILDSDFNL